MVFFGVAFEVFIAAKNPPYGSVMERWGSSVADAFVALGVLGEVLAASRGRVIQGEMTRRSNDQLADAMNASGSAKERAAKAELQAAEARERTAEIEKLTAWRRLSPESGRAITESLRAKSSQIIASVEYQTGDPESHMLASEIWRSIRDAGVNDVHLGANFHLNNTIFQTFVVMPPDNEDGMILEAFNLAGILPIPGQGVVFKKGANGEPRNLYVWVGPKPPPSLSTVAAETSDKPR